MHTVSEKFLFMSLSFSESPSSQTGISFKFEKCKWKHTAKENIQTNMYTCHSAVSVSVCKCTNFERSISRKLPNVSNHISS